MDFKQHKNDIIALTGLAVILIAIIALLYNVDGKAGVYYVRDVFFYLNNALFYAGHDTGLADTRGLSPLIPMITSLFFRLGFISDTTIILVSSSFYLFAGLGMYLLLRLRFNEVLSFSGSMILETFPLIIVWIVKGMLDIPGMCISIWAVYFMLLSFRKDIRFSYIAFPLVILGFFTRYTVLLMILVLLIQYLFVKNPLEYIKSNIKHIILAICSAAVVFAVFIGIYSYLDIGLFFVSQGQDITGNAQDVGSLVHYFTYYLINLPIYIGTEYFIPFSVKPGAFLVNEMHWIGGEPSFVSYILQIIMASGAILYLAKMFNKENRKKLDLKNNKIALIIFIAGLVAFYVTYVKISVVYSIILISITILALYKLLDRTDVDFLSMDFVMLYWFAVNFVFFTYYHIKVDRYFIPMLPFIAYAIVLSMDLIFEKISSIKHSEKIKKIAPIALVCVILLSCGFYGLSNTPHTYDNQMHENYMTAAAEEKDVGNWLANHDPQYMNKTIWADRGGDMSFILIKEIPSVERIRTDANFTDQLVAGNVTYYITNYNNTVGEPFVKLYQNGNVTLYLNEK